ncbi:MAG: tyrosine-type recombinase/integrase [Acidobacteriota bacterium]|nr:tyrosine-type recombinase/integrase [Acidobacteriota bacterium]
MGVYPRDKKKRDRWFYKFIIRGITYKRAIPEARTETQAKQVERLARQAVFEGRYGRQAGTESFTKFVDGVYIPWAKINKRSWYHDTRYVVILCDYFKGKTFGDITPMLVEHYKKHRREGVTRLGTNRNMATVNRELALLSKIFSLAVDNGYTETNPCRKVRRFRVDNRRERVLSDDEEAQLLEALAGRYASLRPVVVLALNTGMRRGEMLALRWPDVDFAGRAIHLPRDITKNGRARSIPFNEDALAALVELKEDAGGAEHVLAGLGYGKGALSKKLSAATALAGITGVTLHTFRHTFATRLKDEGIDLSTVRDLLGHATIQMTNHYTHATPETMRRGVEALVRRREESTRIVPRSIREIA